MAASGTLFGDNPIPTAARTGWITAHCDGGARGNPGPAGFGAVIAAEDGHTLAELSEFLGVCSNNVAEYAGLLATLDWALTHNYGRLKVVSDSLLMVNQIKGRFKVNSPDLRPLWQTARDRIAKLDAFDISHALRHKNKDADRLANEAMDRGTNRNRSAESSAPPARPAASPSKQTPAAARSTPAPAPAMLRGFVRDGAIHLLGDARLPDGVFVKVIPE